VPEVASGKEVEQHERCATVAVILRGVLHGAVRRSAGTDLRRVYDPLPGEFECMSGPSTEVRDGEAPIEMSTNGRCG